MKGSFILTGGSRTYTVKLSGTDAIPGYLLDKLKEGTNIVFTEVIEGGIKKLMISATVEGGGYDWAIHSPEQIIGDRDEPASIIATIDGTGAVDETIPAGTYAIVAVNDAGETLPVDVPEMVILVDTTSVVISWDAVTGAIGYRVYEVATGNYYDLVSTSWDYLTETPATAGTLPVANTAYIYQSPFVIEDGDNVAFIGEGIDVETEVDEIDPGIKWIRFIKQQSTWSETNPDSPNFIPGKPTALDGREIELQENAGWVEWRYVGDATWTQLFEIPTPAVDNSVEIYIDFLDTTAFVFTAPYAMKFTSQTAESGAATLSPVLDTVLAQYDDVTITPAAAGLVTLTGVKL